MIGKFGAAKDQWFSSFLLQVENHSSWHRLMNTQPLFTFLLHKLKIRAVRAVHGAA